MPAEPGECCTRLPAVPSDRPPAPARLRRTAWLLFGFLTCVYLLTGKGFSDILDAEGYFLIARALVEERSVGVTPELSSAVLRGTEPTRDGRAFLHFGIGYPLVLTPFYVAGKWSGQAAMAVSPGLGRFERFFPRAATSAALALITAGTAVALMLLLVHLGWSPQIGAAGGLVLGLATFAWPYAKIGFYEPFLGLCQLLALLWAAVYATSRRPGWLLAAGFAAGWGIAAKPSMALLLPVLAGYVLWAALRERGGLRRLAVATGATLAGLAPWVVVMLWYNAARAGDPTDIGYAAGNYMPVLSLGHIAEAIRGNIYSPGRGFFVFSPVAVLFVFGIRWFWRNARAELVAILTLIVLNFGFFATRGNWATIRPWGPRYLESLIPLFVLLAVPALVAAWRLPWGRWAVGALVGVSVCVQLLAISMPFNEWIERVKEETGSGFSTVFNVEYSPLWGQVVLLSDASLAPIDAPAAEIAHGEPSETLKRELRRTPDFWFAYAYRLGAPRAPLVVGVLALLGLCVWLGIALWQSLRPPAGASN